MSALNESIFENTGLTSIVIPANINTLNNTAFKNVSNLQTVTFSAASISFVGSSVFEGYITNINLTKISGTNFGTATFKGCTSLLSVTIAKIYL